MSTLTREQEKKRWKKGGRRITLKWDGTCRDCGASLPAGTTARWYGRGRIYGLTCHEQTPLKSTPQNSGIPTPGGFKGFTGLFDPEPIPTPQAPQPRTSEPKNYDCTKNPFEKKAPKQEENYDPGFPMFPGQF